MENSLIRHLTGGLPPRPMRLFFTITFLLLIVTLAAAQQRTVSGRLTDPNGEPTPGVSVMIKGTTIGTVADADGYYSIQVPIGATLVFSFIGMQTREVLVTADNLRPVSGRSPKKLIPLKPFPRSLFRASADTVGVATLTDESPTYRTPGSTLNPDDIQSIRKLGANYHVRMRYTDDNRARRLSLVFGSSLTVERVNKLPSLQSRYAQGQPQGGAYQWQGADQQTIYSWGPLVRTLEFDGSNYAFDVHGRLVPAGTGNGKAAYAYNARKLFQTGIATVNELTLTLPAARNSTLKVDLENRTRQGIIPHSNYRQTLMAASLKAMRLSDRLTFTPSLTYSQSSGTLLTRGANLSSIVGSIYRTPVTFNNAAGYQLPDGTNRSHAPALADNPYGLVHDLPDHESNQRLLASADLDYRATDRLSFTWRSNIDWQQLTSVFGNAPGYSAYSSGRRTNRQDDQSLTRTMLSAVYRPESFYNDVALTLAYEMNRTQRSLYRKDGFGFTSTDSYSELANANSITTLDGKLIRQTHELTFSTRFERQWLRTQVANRAYFSNTVDYSRFTNFFPSASVTVNMTDLLYMWRPQELSVYGTVARSIRETPLLYSAWSYGSTSMAVSNYNTFYESGELFAHAGLAPETEVKLETGVRLRTSSNVAVHASYFSNHTRNFIAPLQQAASFTLDNVAAIHTNGVNISAEYEMYFPNGNWGTDVRWSTYRSQVDNTYGPTTVIPLAGFETVQRALVPGQSFGAIYGTTYARNAEGKKIIGSDGFPVEDATLRKIGNIIPDWILGWSAFANYKKWKIAFVFDFKKGGDMWNGTNSVLDYLGRSGKTAAQRGISNYVFDGVDINNNPNVIPVNFSDPTRPLSENRWVRYGWDGVGEAYIEDATWFRLSELTLSYSLPLRQSRIQELKVSFVGRNLFLITPYSGVDPSSLLQGYSTGAGLDLFNLPSTRTLGVQVTIKL